MTRINCRLSIQDPSLSTRSPRTVDAIATISCTAPVQSLGISVDLYRNGEIVGRSGPVNNNGSATLQGTAAAPCTKNSFDYYYGIAEGNVTYPPGYSPPTWSASTRSFTVTGLNCDSSPAAR